MTNTIGTADHKTTGGPAGLQTITGLDAKTITALVITAAVQANSVLAAFGITPVSLDQQDAYTACSVVVALINVAYTVWHNFNFTKAARAGQTVTDRIKDGSLTSLTSLLAPADTAAAAIAAQESPVKTDEQGQPVLDEVTGTPVIEVDR